MNSFSVPHLLVVALASALAIVALMVITAVLAQRLGRVSVVDVVWGLGFVLVALVSAVVGGLLEGVTVRAWVIFVLVAVWGGRLAWHIAERSKGGGEDPRYEKIMGREGAGGIVRRVLLPQGAVMWFVSLPVQVAALSSSDLGVPFFLGILLWVVGFGFETIGDRQLEAYKQQDPKPQVMDQGLWRYTRHPNYFGDATMWWGLWLMAADVWPGVLTILSPLAMTYFLVFVSGAKLLEQTMMKRPGYSEYAERTSMFFPLPPRSS